MKNNIFRFLGYTAGVITILLLLAVFLPRSYRVPRLEKRSGTQYWHLPTGSLIAFTHIAATNSRRKCPVIYLHGGPGGHIRQGVITSLSPLAEDGYDLYFYDQVGGGLSARLSDINDYSVDRHVQDLNAIIKQLGDCKVILIGQSWGAILAAIFTARYPEKVERIVLTSPGPIYPVRGELKNQTVPDSIHLKPPLFTNRQGNHKANNIRTKAMAFFATSFGWRISSDEEADAFATYLGYEIDKSTVCDTANIPGIEAGNGFYAAITTYKSLLNIKDCRPLLKGISIPMLVIKGSCDNIPWGYTKEYLDIFRDHRLVIIPDAGHFLWVEQPGLYLKAVRQFL